MDWSSMFLMPVTNTRATRMGVLMIVLITFYTLSTSFVACFNIEDLTSKHYPRLISNDIYMDPCKSGNILTITTLITVHQLIYIFVANCRRNTRRRCDTVKINKTIWTTIRASISSIQEKVIFCRSSFWSTIVDTSPDFIEFERRGRR